LYSPFGEGRGAVPQGSQSGASRQAEQAASRAR
jgi:hypothetical protein